MSNLRSERMKAARKKGTHTELQWAALLRATGNVCCRCGSDEYRLERDHIKPVYQGGCDCIANIQPSCARCNASKGSETIDYRNIQTPEWSNKYFRIMLALETE